MKKLEKTQLLQLFGKICTVIVITTVVCLCGMSASCKVSPEGITILETDYSTPKLVNIQISNSKEIYLKFDKEITLKQLKIASKNNPEDFYFVDVKDFEKNLAFYITCENQFSFLDSYEIFGVVEDEKYNTLTFSSVLTGFNENLPKIAISELRTYYQKPKLEFIELVAESSGNLAGMILEIYYKEKPLEFVFPPVEVEKGDFLIIHGRTVDETCINESENLEEATHKDAVSGVLDFWLDSDSKVIGNSGAILIRERKNGKPVEALLYTEPSKEDWGTSYIKEAAQEAIDAGVWVGSSTVEDAAINVKPSGTRSLSKDFSLSGTANFEEGILSKDLWIFVNNGNATMGGDNSLIPYEG